MKPKLAILSHDLPTIKSIVSAVARIIEPVWAKNAAALDEMVMREELLTCAIIDDKADAKAIATLAAIAKRRPRVRRVLLTTHCDLSMIVNGLHSGAVQQIVYQPIYAPELLAALELSTAPAAPLNPMASVAAAALQ